MADVVAFGDGDGSRAKSSVNYSAGDGKDYCGICRFYKPSPNHMMGRCRLVGGKIEANMWCALFAPALPRPQDKQ